MFGEDGDIDKKPIMSPKFENHEVFKTKFYELMQSRYKNVNGGCLPSPKSSRVKIRKSTRFVDMREFKEIKVYDFDKNEFIFQTGSVYAKGTVTVRVIELKTPQINVVSWGTGPIIYLYTQIPSKNLKPPKMLNQSSTPIRRNEW